MTVPLDPTTIDGPALLELVRCPPVREDYTPREQASPSALQQYAACKRSWGERYLHGRRETSLEWEYASQIPEPPKPGKGWAALAKVEAEDARKAWNKVRRPALGGDVHDILDAYMVQNTPGAWHPPMRWREVDWTSHAGRIARPAADVLPDPRGLVAVYTELAVELVAPEGWAPFWTEHLPECGAKGEACACPEVEDKPWPHMPGFYDLITVETKHYPDSYESEAMSVLRYRLWDYKTTSSFDWAKTAEELTEDPQVLLYALHAMQTFGLEDIECNWVYLRTEDSPKSYVVTVHITRADAERAVLEMAETAAEVCSNVRLFAAGRLRVVDLEQDVSACKAYGGCIYHTDKGGPCDARVSPGKALKQKAALEAKIKARKSARKEADMSLSFAERQAAREKEKAAKADSAPAAVAQGEGIGGGETAPNGGPAAGADAAASGAEPAAGGGSVADASAASSAATAKLRENKSKATKASQAVPESGGILVSVTMGETVISFPVPPSSALGKSLGKAGKAYAALEAAYEGE